MPSSRTAPRWSASRLPQGFACRSAGGITWGVPAMILAGREPTFWVEDGAWLVYFTRSDAPGIFLARSTDGVTFQPEPDPVLLPGTSFDAAAVTGPAVARAVSERFHLSLFYTGAAADGARSVGYAASFDGVTFVRPDDDRPVLQHGARGERDPAVLLTAAQALMFYADDDNGRLGIAAATSP